MNKLVQRLVHVLFLLGFAGIVATGAMIACPKYRKVQGLHEQRDRLLRMIEDKQREISELKARQRRFNSDREFVESLARQNRCVRPNELLFVFED